MPAFKTLLRPLDQLRQRIYHFFEQLIDPFDEREIVRPPETVGAFYRHYIRQIKPVLFTLLLFGLIAALIEVSLFAFIGHIVDIATHTTAPDFFAQYWPTLLLMAFVIIVLRPVCNAIPSLLEHQTVNPGLTALVRWQSHRYMLKQSIAFFNNDFAGRIANRVLQTGDALRQSTVGVVDALWTVVVYTMGSLTLFAQADWRLTVPLLTWLVLYLSALTFFIPQVRRRATIASEARSVMTGRIIDGYTNISTLKLFGETRFEEDYVSDAMRDHTHKIQSSNRVITSMDFTITVLNGLLIVATAGLALWLWSANLVTIGLVTLATGLVLRINNMSAWIMWSVNGIFDNIGTVQDGMASLTKERDVTDLQAASALKVSQGALDFHNVTFGYGSGPDVIAGLNLHINPGEKIGLVGPSGAGKSTLVSILLRLYDIRSGQVCIDGQNIASHTQESLRRQIGVVSQDTSLLHRSIRDNLLYGRPDSTDDDIHQALRAARADAFVPSLTDMNGRTGLDAHVGERGVKLSGGQRQRISIARVLLKNAPILILDEATSALDSEVEAVIQDSLETLMNGKTVIAIAHRLSTIAKMDRLIVFDEGKVVETGHHSELIAAGGLYARLWQRQTGGFLAVS